MERASENWSTEQLAELLALVSSIQDADEAVERGLERASEALEAEFCAIVRDGSVVSALGFGAGDLPEGDLIAIAEGGAETLDYAYFNGCEALSVPLEDDSTGRLVLVRVGGAFSADEKNLVRGMARVLTLAVRMLRRQTLLERLSRIQRSIVRRAALQEVLDGIVTGASELLGDEVAAVRLVEPHSPTQMVMVASFGVDDELAAQLRRGSVGKGVGGRAISEGGLIVEEAYADAANALPVYKERGLVAAMAAPVLENGVPMGSLTVASYRRGRRYTKAEQEVLLAFAEHASLALTDARNFEDAIHQAFHDSLTGLANRALLLDRLEHAHARAKRTGAPIAVLFMDLDSFKTVNDSLGHAAGDELLVLVAARLRRFVRPSDTAARFGGDEFAILLEDMEAAEDAVYVAERILDSLREPFAVQGQEVYVTGSIGIATNADPGADDLLRNADLAMYRAKGRGKGRYQKFEPRMHAAVLERLELEVDLQRAIERGEMEVYYQPIVLLRTGEISAVEALVRWNHPTRGRVGPDEFIPLAEDTGQILRLGQWVLGEACRTAAAWNRGVREGNPVAVGVNLSARQLQEPSLVGEIAATLAESSFPPELLILEITETILMQDLEGTVAKLQELRRIGVRMSVDDFGTGYSSLQYLRRFPLDSLKIAKSFVDGVGGPSQDAAVARAIVDLGSTFGLRVVAEGIERRDQCARLVELGCDYGQGFLFARPAPAAEVEQLLTRRSLVVRV